MIQVPDTILYHAGTAVKDGKLVVNGGRVANLVGLGETLDLSIGRAYVGTGVMRFPGMDFRRDIGKRVPPQFS